jgi:hypothetical protein
MTRTNQILIALLVLQGAFLALRGLSSEPEGAFQRGPLIVGIERDQVETIRVEGPEDDERATLEKAGDGWAVSESAGYPADPTKVDEVLRELFGLEVADLVSTTRNHHVDLKVSEKDFQRKLILEGGGGSVELYFGTSGRAGSTHARRAGDDEVYAVRDFSSWKLGSRPDGWVEREYLTVDREQIISVDYVGRFRLDRSATGWTLTGADGVAETAKADEVDKVLDKLETVRLSEVVGPASVHPLSEGAVEVRLGLGSLPPPPAEGDEPTEASPVIREERVLRIAPMADDENNFLLHVDGKSHVVQVGSWAMKPVLEASVQTLRESS